MADEEHLRILKEGVEAWNRWRMEHWGARVDLHEADLGGVDLSRAQLYGADLRRADLSRADLGGAQLREANLREADLDWANLSRADLSRADLGGAYLRKANLGEAYLGGADLGGASLRKADLRGADLSGANLHGAKLREAKLSGAKLSGAKLSGADLGWAALIGADLWRAEFGGAYLGGARIGSTVFGDVDLSEVKGLEAVVHGGPSTVGIDTIYKSKGKIPEVFLRGCGVPEEFITYMGSLVGRAIEYYSCFISYSSKDEAFAKRLHEGLQAEGVRCWFAPEDMKIGDKIWDRLDQSIRLHDKLLVILSGNSVGSEWVEDEVMTAFEEERKRHKIVLFPVRLDDAVMESKEAWAGLVRQRHIGDFRGWKEHEAYREGFERLMRDLKAEGNGWHDR